MNLNIEKVDLNELISPDFNPRQITKAELEKLKNSINEFGYIEPIIVNRQNNHIIGGNQRARALKELGETKIDVIYVDMKDSEQEKMLSIALNKIGGEWDEDKLSEIFKELKVEGVDLDLTGFTDVELEEFIDDDLEFDLVVEEEKDPVKEVVFVEKEVEPEPVVEESTVEEKPVEEKTIEIKETKYDKPTDEPKNKLVKKEVNIVEEYKQDDEETIVEEEEYVDDYVADEVEEPAAEETVEETKSKKYDPYPHIPIPDYLPLAPIKKIIRDAGAERVSDGACKLLGNVLEENAKQISEKAVMMANVAGRKIVTDEDFEIILKS